MSSVKATRRSTKEHNLRLILKTFYENEEISRADAARATGLAKATVSELVNELIQQGLISESRYAEALVGKPPLLLEIARNGRHLICADLANQEFQGAIVNLRGDILHTIHIPRKGRVGQAAIELVYQLVDALLEKTTCKLLGIGIGTPGLIDSTNGFVQYAVNMEWRDIPLGELLKTRYGLPVHIANDSQIAALAESQFGQCQPNSNHVTIKLGRGIGAGIVLNGQLYQGDGYGAGEIGHIRVVENGLPCQCGNTGCLETVASSRAVVERAQTLARARPHSILHTLPPDDINLARVRQAYEEKDALAIEIVHEAGCALGTAIANLIGILNIQSIILSGDMTVFGDPWLTAIRQNVNQSALTTLAAKTEIKFSCLTENEVIQGASALLLTRELGIAPEPNLAAHVNGSKL
jgi:N-acetylglucosamine repressor